MADRTADGAAAVSDHHHAYFRGHDITDEKWTIRPTATRLPGLYVHEVSPGPRLDAWTYLTVGAWDSVHTADGHGLEFLMTAPARSRRLVELLTIAAYYHGGPEHQRLDLGHTVPIGEPWLPGSACDQLLVSLPYMHGPDLEQCRWESGHARLLWLVPITEPERFFGREHGLDALEQRLEDAQAQVIDPLRSSVV